MSTKGTESMSSGDEAIRDEVAAWLDDQWSPDLTVREWWRRSAAAGSANCRRTADTHFLGG